MILQSYIVDAQAVDERIKADEKQEQTVKLLGLFRCG